MIIQNTGDLDDKRPAGQSSNTTGWADGQRAGEVGPGPGEDVPPPYTPPQHQVGSPTATGAQGSPGSSTSAYEDDNDGTGSSSTATVVPQARPPQFPLQLAGSTSGSSSSTGIFSRTSPPRIRDLISTASSLRASGASSTPTPTTVPAATRCNHLVVVRHETIHVEKYLLDPDLVIPESVLGASEAAGAENSFRSPAIGPGAGLGVGVGSRAVGGIGGPVTGAVTRREGNERKNMDFEFRNAVAVVNTWIAGGNDVDWRARLEDRIVRARAGGVLGDGESLSKAEISLRCETAVAWFKLYNDAARPFRLSISSQSCLLYLAIPDTFRGVLSIRQSGGKLTFARALKRRLKFVEDVFQQEDDNEHGHAAHGGGMGRRRGRRRREMLDGGLVDWFVESAEGSEMLPFSEADWPGSRIDIDSVVSRVNISFSEGDGNGPLSWVLDKFF